MGKQHRATCSYLLRLWPTSTTEPQPWQASIENVQTGERLGFANLEQLFVFLMQLIIGRMLWMQSKAEVRREPALA